MALLGVAGAARAQLVPLSQCGSALPCSIPVGLRPPDAAAVSPFGRAGAGNTLISVSAAIDEGLKPSLVKREIAEDPADRAARLFIKRNPFFSAPKTKPTPTPAPSAPKDLQLP